MSNEQTIHSSTKAHRSERTDHNVIAMYILKSLGLSVSETDNKIGDSTREYPAYGTRSTVWTFPQDCLIKPFILRK
jgi:hypothetical protein